MTSRPPKLALHLGHPEPLRELQPEPIEERGLGFVGTHDAPQFQLATVVKREDDVDTLNAMELLEQSPWTRAKSRPCLPACECLPQRIRQEANENVPLCSLGLLMPHRPNL